MWQQGARRAAWLAPPSHGVRHLALQIAPGHTGGPVVRREEAHFARAASQPEAPPRAIDPGPRARNALARRMPSGQPLRMPPHPGAGHLSDVPDLPAAPLVAPHHLVQLPRVESPVGAEQLVHLLDLDGPLAVKKYMMFKTTILVW